MLISAHFVLVHTAEEVEPLRPKRRNADDDRTAFHSVRKQRRCSQRRRATARYPGNPELPELKRVRDHAHVSRRIHHPPARDLCGEAITGPVVGEHPQTVAQVVAARLTQQPAPRRPLQPEHRGAVRISPYADAQPPTIRSTHDACLFVHGGFSIYSRRRIASKDTPSK